MHSILQDVGHLAEPSRLKINEMLDASTEDRPFPNTSATFDSAGQCNPTQTSQE